MTTGIQSNLNDKTISAAFNEWMRRYTEEPERFSREWQVVAEYLAETAAGKEPTYGEGCAEYLHRLIEEQASA